MGKMLVSCGSGIRGFSFVLLWFCRFLPLQSFDDADFCCCRVLVKQCCGAVDFCQDRILQWRRTAAAKFCFGKAAEKKRRKPGRGIEDDPPRSVLRDRVTAGAQDLTPCEAGWYNHPGT